jgi:DNA-binding GntR family transcriptional regulator
VSRTPVREALTRLVQEGYVSFLPNRGFTCKEIRIQEAEELYDLREAMEAFAVERATAHLTQAALDQLRRKMDRYGETCTNASAVSGWYTTRTFIWKSRNWRSRR